MLAENLASSSPVPPPPRRAPPLLRAPPPLTPLEWLYPPRPKEGNSSSVDVKLLFAGRGEEEDVVELRARELGLEERAHFAGYLQGEELVVAILFVDLRAFTRLSEKKLPSPLV